MKLSIIGAGNVGATLAKRIVENDLADVVLLDIAKGLARGKSLDLLQARPVVKHNSSVLGTEDYKHTKDSDIIVITAGLARKPGMSRDDLMAKNAGIVKGIVANVSTFSPKAIILMVTNPLDIMTYVALKVSGLNRKKVFGMAGVLDSSRFAHFIADELKISTSEVEAMVLGGHGDTMVPLLSQTKISNKPLLESLPLKKITQLVERTRSAGAEIVTLLGSGSAYYAPSAACFLMVRAIIKDEKRLMAASSFLNGEYGLKGLCLGVPVRLGAGGIEEIVEMNISEEERKALEASALTVKNRLEALNINKI